MLWLVFFVSKRLFSFRCTHMQYIHQQLWNDEWHKYVKNGAGAATIYRCVHYPAQIPTACCTPGPLFTKRYDVLPQDLVKSWSREIGSQTFSIALKLDGNLDSSSADIPVKFQSETMINIPSRGCETSRDLAVRPLTAKRIEARDSNLHGFTYFVGRYTKSG